MVVCRRWQLSRTCPYDSTSFEHAASVAAGHPGDTLGTLNLQGLIFVAAGYATAQHLHAGLLEAIGDEISNRMLLRATQVLGGRTF